MNGHPIRMAAGLVALAGLVTAAGCTEPDEPDPVARGERIHAVCMPCHGTSVYTSPQSEINTLPALRQEVARWGDYYNPALSPQDIDDVTAYLNATFYRLQER